MALIDKEVRALPQRSQRYRLLDGAGLLLEVDPAGGKYWLWRHRFPPTKDGRQHGPQAHGLRWPHVRSRLPCLGRDQQPGAAGHRPAHRRSPARPHREEQGHRCLQPCRVLAAAGYGSYSNSTSYGTGLAYIDSTLTGATSIGAIPLIARDTTPGQEYFCWALKTHGGNDDLHRDSCHTLYKSPGTTGWNSIAVFPRTSKQFYGQVVLHGYSGNRFGGLPSAIGSSIHANGHQLRSGIALGHYDFVLQAQGLFDSPPPLIQLPAPLFIGSTSIRGASTHFGKVTRPDGVMLQLGQRSSDRDVWLWVPAGTSHNQASPWSSATSLSHWRECNELHFISGLPPQGLQLITGTADFIRHFPAMSAMGARQHPQQGPLLSGSGGGGSGGGGGGETGGGAARPSTGLL